MSVSSTETRGSGGAEESGEKKCMKKDGFNKNGDLVSFVSFFALITFHYFVVFITRMTILCLLIS